MSDCFQNDRQFNKGTIGYRNMDRDMLLSDNNRHIDIQNVMERQRRRRQSCWTNVIFSMGLTFPKV